MGKYLNMFIALLAIVRLGDAASLFGQSQQQVQQGFPGLGSNLPGGLDGVLGEGPRGRIGSSLAPVLGSLGGSRGGGGDGGRADGILGGYLPSVLGNGRSSTGLGGQGGGSGPNTGSGGLGTPTSGSVGPGQGAAPGFPGILGAALGGIPGSPLTPGGSSTTGYGLGGRTNRGVGPGRAGEPPMGGSGGPSGNAAGPGAFGRGSDSGPDLSRPNQAFGPSLSSNGQLGPGGSGGSGVLGGSLPAPSLGSRPEPALGGEIGVGGSVSRPPSGVSGPEYRLPASSTGLFGPEGRGGPARTGGSLSVPATVIGPTTSLGGEFRLPSPLPGIPGGHLGPGSLSAGSSSGPGGASSMGTGVATSTGPGLPRAETRLRDGALPGRRGPGIQKPAKKLDQTTAAAIGLGVAGGALALSALAAGIASAIQHRPRSAGLVGARRSCPGCLPTPCVRNCGRKRRSVPTSKVPSEILDNIPMNFERLY